MVWSLHVGAYIVVAQSLSYERCMFVLLFYACLRLKAESKLKSKRPGNQTIITSKGTCAAITAVYCC